MRTKRLLLTLVCLLTGIMFAAAQALPTIPNDPDVRIGRLDNGLTYYIRHNEKPAGMAEFFIFHDVGAIQEEDSQIGLAHFLEHMAFNGTKNLPGKQLINWLETVGVKFGINLNAGTGVERTTYMLQQVPVNRESVIDSALLILHDWSYFITLDPQEIDNERGVIIEELRQGNTGARRVQEKIMPVLYNKNRFGYRNVIGTEEQLRKFSHQEIIDFYHRWYRPDLQALVIVGDFDVDKMEQKVRTVMADIPKAVNPEPKAVLPVADNTEPMIAIETDPELTSSDVDFLIKRPAVPNAYNNTIAVYMLDQMLEAASTITNLRLAEIAEKPGAPFLSANFGNISISDFTDGLYGSVSARNGEIPQAFEAFYAEIEKVRRYGFTPSEFERVKIDMLRAAECTYEARNDKRSGQFVRAYIGNYSQNAPMPSAEDMWKIDQQVIENMTLEDVNAIMNQFITPTNQVVLVTGPQKEGVTMPTQQQMLDIINRVHAAELQPYLDNTITEPLISTQIKPGKVVKTESGMFGSTVWTLSNGVRVVLKPTDLRADQVTMNVKAFGGTSALTDADHLTATMMGDLIGMSGVGKFSKNDLSKMLTGKVAKVTPSLDRFTTGMNGSSSKRDIETMLQLTYLYFNQPRWSQDDFNRMIDNTRTNLTNSQNTPNFVLMMNFIKTMFNNNPRTLPMTLDRLDDVDFNRMAPIYSGLYDNAGRFTFTFVGDFDMEKLKPMVEKYLGSLPVNKNKVSIVDDNMRMVRGEVENRFSTPMEAPMTTVIYVYSGDMAYNLENRLTIGFLESLLDIRYTEVIREEKGGTYGVGVNGELERRPTEKYMLQIFFSTDPNLVDELLEIVENEIRSIAENGPNAVDMAKHFEYLKKVRPEQLKENGTWLNYLSNYYLEGEDFYTDYEKTLNSIDAKKVQAMAAKILKDGNRIAVIMDPVK